MTPLEKMARVAYEVEEGSPTWTIETEAYRRRKIEAMRAALLAIRDEVTPAMIATYKKPGPIEAAPASQTAEEYEAWCDRYTTACFWRDMIDAITTEETGT